MRVILLAHIGNGGGILILCHSYGHLHQKSTYTLEGRIEREGWEIEMLKSNMHNNLQNDYRMLLNTIFRILEYVLSVCGIYDPRLVTYQKNIFLKNY